jgi:hypothetical protein
MARFGLLMEDVLDVDRVIVMAQVRREVRGREIGIDHGDVVAQLRQGQSHVDCQGGLADPALAGDEPDDP